MDLKIVFTKTAKGLTQLNQKTQSLSRDLTKALKLIDGKSTVEQLSDKTGMALPALQKALNELKREGFVKIFEVKVEEPLTDFGGDDDFDFTAPTKMAAAQSSPGASATSRVPAMPAFGPSPYRTPAANDQVARVEVPKVAAAPVAAAPAPAPSPAPKPELPKAPAAPEVDEAALIAARIKSQAEARARAEREAQVRARLEVEARARKEAELRALEEAKRAQEAAEHARAELELRLAEENKQREIAIATREKMTRDQLAEQAEQQKALAAARAKAEAEAHALARARVAAESEAKLLAEARLQADAAAKKQAVEFESAQRDLRQQLKAEIEAQVRAEMEVMLKSDIEESARVEVEAAVRQGAQEDARRMLEVRLVEERGLLERAGAAATQRAEADAKSMLAEQETKIRAEMEERIAALNEEKKVAEATAREMAVAQADAAAKTAAEFSARLKIEEQARQKAQAETEAQRLRLEELARSEAVKRAQVEAEMVAKLAAEKEAKIQAEARALIEQELREKAHQASLAALAIEKEAKAEAEARAHAEQELREKVLQASQAELAAEKEAKAQAEARALAEQEMREQALEANQASQAQLEIERRAREEADRNAAAQRLRLEARAREEALERERVEAEMIAKLAAEKGATADAEARAKSESAKRKQAERASQTELESERRAREEAERKAESEMAAREATSRAASQQAVELERFEQEAEARVQHERALREKAEEKSRLEEEAEAASRAGQVARLRELQEQAERTQIEQSEIASGKRRRPVKRERHLLRWTMVGLLGLFVFAVILIQVVPLRTVNTRLQEALAGWVHDDVSSSGLRIGLFPRPHVKLDQVALGKLFDAKATSGKIYMDMTALFGDRFIIDSFELENVTITDEALGRAARWGDPEGRSKTIEISKIVLKNVKLEIKNINLDPFDAELKFDANGAVTNASMRTKGNKWTVDIAPAAASTTAGGPAAAPSEFKIDVSAREIVSPIGAAVPLDSLSAKGTFANQQMILPDVKAKFFDGSATGALKIDWKQGINVSGNLNVQRIKLDQLTEVFTRAVSLGGRLDGEFTVAALAGSVSAILDQPKIQGNFVVKEGSIGNADLVQVMRSTDGNAVGGQSKFSDLTGQLKVGDGVIRYERLKLAGGVLLANGNVNVVYSTGALSGSVGSEIRSNVAQDRAIFSVSGNVARPVLKRGGL